jgi:ferric-dicitrate binding protein FerR (iron transport regulator)
LTFVSKVLAAHRLEAWHPKNSTFELFPSDGFPTLVRPTCIKWSKADSVAAEGDIIRVAPQKPRHSDRLIRIRRITQACVALALLLRGATDGTPPPSKPVIYTTALGEHAYIYLDDRSKIELNTGSSVLVNYSATARSIILLRGEAWLEVRHGDQRPFRVYSGPSVIEDMGTQFDVFRRGDSTRVTVTDGRIRINSATSDAQTELHAGQQVELSGQSGMVLNRATLSADELSRLPAWREE